jgi:hypothetical protein
MKKTWFTDVKEDENGELFIELPEDLLKEMGWGDNTALWWEVDQIKNTVTLSAKDPEDEIG